MTEVRVVVISILNGRRYQGPQIIVINYEAVVAGRSSGRRYRRAPQSPGDNFASPCRKRPMVDVVDSV